MSINVLWGGVLALCGGGTFVRALALAPELSARRNAYYAFLPMGVVFFFLIAAFPFFRTSLTQITLELGLFVCAFGVLIALLETAKRQKA